MCGIFGLILDEPKPFSAGLASTCSDLLKHRGPDGEGWLTAHGEDVKLEHRFSGDVTTDLLFMHRRLAIIDISDAGLQPMSSADGRYHITYNGEIYNYIEIKKELEQAGHVFSTNTDTEVLLNAYIEWGAAALDKFVGMFALAIFDLRRDEVLLARDPFGIKPLYYAVWDGGVAFCSEIPPLLELPYVGRVADAQSYYDYLCSGATDLGQRTMFRDVSQLPPATYMRIDRDRAIILEENTYWQLTDFGTCSDSFETASETIREMFKQSVRLHLRSDVPLGAALSGGIDSSSISCVAADLLPDGRRLDSFSFVADQERLSEEVWMDEVNSQINAEPHKIHLESNDVAEDLEALIRLQGEPFGSTSILAQLNVFKHAKAAGIKVMLDGQGADELLAGYLRYFGLRLASMIRTNSWRKLVESFLGPLQKSDIGALRSLAFLWSNMTQGAGIGFYDRIRGRGSRLSWLDMGWFASRVDPNPWIDRTDIKAGLHGRLRDDVQSISLPRLLRYADRNSMHFSIESRVPFLTPEFAEYVFSLPESYLIDDEWTTKSVFRTAMRGIVPQSVLDRKDKIGFVPPEQDWIRRERVWATKILDGETAKRLPGLRLDQMKAQLDAICNGNVEYHQHVWRWLCVIEWARVFDVEFE